MPGEDEVELRIRGAQPPSAVVARCARRWSHAILESQAPDDWRGRRLLDYREHVIAGRLVVRPEWAPSSPDPGMIDISVPEDLAFGGGAHPTTRAILEILLDTPPAGSFADLGCGSGVLGILAAKLGVLTGERSRGGAAQRRVGPRQRPAQRRGDERGRR